MLHQPGRLQDRARDLRRRRPHDDQEGKVNVSPRRRSEALAKEAKKDIVKAYAHVGGPDKAWEFFQRTGGDYAPEDDGVAGRALLGAGQVPATRAASTRRSSRRTWTRRASASGRTRSSATRCRPATRRTRSRRSSASAPSTTRSAEMKGVKKDQLRGVPQHLPRHVQGAGAHLAQGSAEDEEPGHLRARQVRLQGLPRPLPEGQGRLRDDLLLRRAPVDAGELEGRRRAVHQGRRDEPGRQVRQGRGLRRGARLEERAQRRRPRAEGAGREGPRASSRSKKGRTSSSRWRSPSTRRR